MQIFKIYDEMQLKGIYKCRTETEAILAMHRDAGYGENCVWIDEEGFLSFNDEDIYNGSQVYVEYVDDDEVEAWKTYFLNNKKTSE